MPTGAGTRPERWTGYQQWRPDRLSPIGRRLVPRPPASLVDLFTSQPDLVLAYTGIRHHYNRSTPGQIEGEPLQLVQTMHRRTRDRWLERSELTTDDLERMLWSRLRARVAPRGPVSSPASGSTIPVSDTSSSASPSAASTRIDSIATCASRCDFIRPRAISSTRSSALPGSAIAPIPPGRRRAENPPGRGAGLQPGAGAGPRGAGAPALWSLDAEPLLVQLRRPAPPSATCGISMSRPGKTTSAAFSQTSSTPFSTGRLFPSPAPSSTRTQGFPLSGTSRKDLSSVWSTAAGRS